MKKKSEFLTRFRQSHFPRTVFGLEIELRDCMGAWVALGVWPPRLLVSPSYTGNSGLNLEGYREAAFLHRSVSLRRERQTSPRLQDLVSWGRREPEQELDLERNLALQAQKN